MLKSGVPKAIGFHTFRYLFATHLLEVGYDIRTIQEILEHSDVSIALVYTHVLNRGDLGVQSPIDRMGFIPLACLVKIGLIGRLYAYSVCYYRERCNFILCISLDVYQFRLQMRIFCDIMKEG